MSSHHPLRPSHALRYDAACLVWHGEGIKSRPCKASTTKPFHRPVRQAAELDRQAWSATPGKTWGWSGGGANHGEAGDLGADDGVSGGNADGFVAVLLGSLDRNGGDRSEHVGL
ncbi:hypothetical protein K402DRAFT_200697 [Aulographum hederae CBS 113979]|uniref:Uncharacterized protein n=1 Tax=Aulographum hederae CBS 113979 TaxID=1176131 RepID=A0A6G1HBP7_9PEZI|nr:hypothetical protein K402DRAFT_200697 [Aulographum hederae CBS 113979]